MEGAVDRVTVLLVEDSPEYTLLVEEMLRDGAADAITLRNAASLADAHRELRAMAPDCILLDLSLPDAQGLHALAEVTQAAPETPVVVLSGSGDEEIAVRAVQDGAQDYLVKHDASGDLLLRAIRYAMERKSAQLDLARMAFHDSLTELPNRRLLMDRLTQALARVDRTTHPVALLFLDLDGFKAVNDRHGHDAGDELLAKVAVRLRSQVRAAETVARYGGDEFVVLCDDVTAEAEVEALASRIVAALSRPFELIGEQIQLGASVGIAIATESAVGAEDLVRDADRAMFQAKESGAPFEIAAGKDGRRFHSKPQIEAELARAIERNELILEYQPEVDLRSHAVFAVEALVRWRHPERGLLPPSEFIPAAEASGLIVPIGDWVVDAACRQLTAWRRAGSCGDNLSMSINLSPRQLGAPELVTTLAEALSRAELPASVICLEVTESTVAAQPERSAETLHELRELGAKIALDDFGMGHSSLGALGGYPVDLLKIDRSFITPLGSGLKARRVFAAILGVAHAFELPAVAEGIETREQISQLAQIGCDAGQGFLLARPAPAEVVEPILKRTVSEAAA